MKPAPVEDVDDEEAADENEVDDDAAFRAPQKASVVAAMMPQAQAKAAAPAPAPVDDEEGDDVEPVPAPKKTIVKKKVIAKAK